MIETLIFFFGAACGGGAVYFLFSKSIEAARVLSLKSEVKLTRFDEAMGQVTAWEKRFKNWAAEINAKPTDKEKKTYFKKEVKPNIPREYTFVRDGRGFRKVLLDNDGEPLFDQEYKE